MRPRLFTARNFALLFVALLILTGMAFWLKSGMPLPGGSVASTAGKIAFLSDRSGHRELWMMDSDGKNPVSLAQNVGGDDPPAWSPDGSTIAFVATGEAAKGGNPQIAEMNAAPGAHVATLTQTTSSKAAPHFESGNRVFYLASGQLVATSSDGTDSDKIFPTFDEQKPLQGDDENPGILSMGGIAQTRLSPDGEHLALTLKTERGEALLYYEIKTQVCDVLGLGERIFFDFTPDGRLLAVFRGGIALPQPGTIFNADFIKAGGIVSRKPFDGAVSTTQTEMSFFDATGTAQHPGRLPFAPDSFALSPDGQSVALGIPEGKLDSGTDEGTGGGNAAPGVALLPLGSGSPSRPFTGPVQRVGFSADGKTLIVVSNGDIFSVPTDGSSAPKNLTNGQGKNSVPVWSPAKPH